MLREHKLTAPGESGPGLAEFSQTRRNFAIAITVKLKARHHVM